ncbi:Chloride transport protein 6 [Exaiptasia diaphana]|nr:Chloride transport protein 6 [Exaiptasia diaphana]
MASINDPDREDYQVLELRKRPKGGNSHKDKLPSKDYEGREGKGKVGERRGQWKEQDLDGRQNLVRWLVTFVIGVLTGLVAVFIDYFVRLLSDWKTGVVEVSGCLVVTLLIMMLFNGGFALIASILTVIEPVAAGSGIPEIKSYLNGVKVPHVVRLKTLVCKAVGVLFSVAGGLFVGKEGPMIHSGAIIGAGVPQPVAAGSGIPEIKSYLNGVKVPHVVRLKTLVCKAVGVLFSVAGGLFVGKEGPMIHSGAIIGAGVPQFQSLAFRKINFNFPYFRTDRDKRDFVSSGAAAGVAAAFGAPIGGVLFSLEEGSSFWNQALTWRTFFCSMSATFTLNFLLSGINNYGWGTFNQPGLINFGVFQCNKAAGKRCDLWNIQDLLIFIVMGFFGGLLGAWFNALNKDLTKHRILHVHTRSKVIRILEAILVALATTAIAFFCPVYLGTCKTYASGAIKMNDTKSYFCTEGQYNDMATLFFNSQEGAVKQLFHLDGAFSLPSLAIFFICFYFLACWTYGASVPSGLFVPCLLCGASYGRFVGEVLRRFFYYDHTYHGTYALIGAASFLGGVVRMTISLTVILIESTNEISYGLPIMITLMVMLKKLKVTMR